MFQDVRIAGKLLFRYDAERELIEVQRRGERFTIDLRQLRQAPQSAKESDNEHQRKPHDAIPFVS